MSLLAIAKNKIRPVYHGLKPKNQYQKLMHWVNQSRGLSLLEKLNNLAINYHRHYENLNFNPHTNGEYNLLKAISTSGVLGRDEYIFDVGANIGEWSIFTSHCFPKSQVFAFEPVPKTFNLLRENTNSLSNVHCFNLGFSSEPKLATIHVNDELSFLATLSPGVVHQQGFVTVPHEIKLETLERFALSNNINQIGFLKIDVEGHELNVLRGINPFTKTSSINLAIRIIQFEYSQNFIEERIFLKDLYDFFDSKSMILGKIYPKFVDFRDYNYGKENFLHANFLAIHKNDSELKKLVSKF